MKHLKGGVSISVVAAEDVTPADRRTDAGFDGQSRKTAGSGPYCPPTQSVSWF